LQFTHIANYLHFKFAPLQITHVTIHPHVEGRIAIRPYTCVFWTFTNMHVNTQKSITGMVWVRLRAS